MSNSAEEIELELETKIKCAFLVFKETAKPVDLIVKDLKKDILKYASQFKQQPSIPEWLQEALTDIDCKLIVLEHHLNDGIQVYEDDETITAIRDQIKNIFANLKSQPSIQEGKKEKPLSLKAALFIKEHFGEFNQFTGEGIITKEHLLNALIKFASQQPSPIQEGEQALKPEHKCVKIAQAQMSEGRDWWLGKLTETVTEFPQETHCLHLKTPLKDVVFLCNAGDFQQLSVLCRHALGYPISESWMQAQLQITKI